MSERASLRTSGRPDVDAVKDLGAVLKVVLCFKTFRVKVAWPSIVAPTRAANEGRVSSPEECKVLRLSYITTDMIFHTWIY